MIIVYHLNNIVAEVTSSILGIIPFERKKTIAKSLYQLASQFPDEKIVWCHLEFKEYLDLELVHELFHHDKLMLSFDKNGSNYFGNKIGYIEDDSPFIKLNKQVSYPTWQMSSTVGVLHSRVLLEIKDEIRAGADFDYFLNSVAKLCMPLGLLCYSEPKLLKVSKVVNTISTQASVYTLFKFVKQHYKTRWVFLLFLNLLIYEKKVFLSAFLYTIFLRKIDSGNICLDAINVNSSLKVADGFTIDVVIPTIGRRNQLYDVLCDLQNQTHLPKNVIIVEQNPLPESVSELNYLYDDKWPFAIKHTFTHQTGACNARNIALSQVESEWVFLNDDDIRFEPDLIEKAFENISKYGIQVLTTSCLQLNEKQSYNIITQSGIFGSGNSFLKSELLKEVTFNESFENGYGEDTDFGFQLRNIGADIIYFPNLNILHLKAPIGGFRSKPRLAWHNESVQPKPSPTVMLCRILHNTQEQIYGYKTIFFVKKMIKNEGWKSLFEILSSFQKQWDMSLFWAKKLKEIKMYEK